MVNIYLQTVKKLKGIIFLQSKQKHWSTTYTLHIGRLAFTLVWIVEIGLFYMVPSYEENTQSYTVDNGFSLYFLDILTPSMKYPCDHHPTGHINTYTKVEIIKN